MTRINTNVSSLTAQKTLAKSQGSLQTALTRLSTGLRINSGKDDPAGLIASEVLRSDMISTERAISNTQRANQMIATADSALGQVTSLLNDIRGLVTEAANEGGMSDDQVAANQLQIDSSLEALNRIAQTTTFQGKKLLDGSLDFITQAGANFDTTVTDLKIDQANLGTAGSMAVNVDITTAAAKASVTNSAAFSAATAATTTVSFAASATTDALAAGAAFALRSNSLGANDGVDIVLADGGAGTTASAALAGNTLTVTVDADTTTAAQIVQAINDEGTFTAVRVGGADANVAAAADMGNKGTTGTATLQLDALIAGAEYNNVTVKFETSATVPAATPSVAFDSTTKELTVTINNAAVTTLADLELAIDGYQVNGVQLFDATDTAAGDTITSISPTEGADIDATASTGNTGGALLLGDLVLELSGATGMEVFNFQKDAGLDSIAAAINLVSDSTGVEATYTSNTLTFNSTEYGSDGFVAANVLSEEASGRFLTGLSSRRATGTDIVATVNGITANGKGNVLSVNTSTLDMTATVSDGSSTDFSFTITGGGGLFQIGPDVVSNQQARLGISSVNSARLGGDAGRLYELASGESAALENDPNKAAKIVEQALNKITSLRGRIGAFQRTTLETNMATLSDTLESLTDAESSIRDADFAKETASLTRAQILVQSGISVLGIANQNPQNVLALLR